MGDNTHSQGLPAFTSKMAVVSGITSSGIFEFHKKTRLFKRSLHNLVTS